MHFQNSKIPIQPKPKSVWTELSNTLKRWCEEHECPAGRYAVYITGDGSTHYVGDPYWCPGMDEPHAVISLPWNGNGALLKTAVLAQCSKHPNWVNIPD